MCDLIQNGFLSSPRQVLLSCEPARCLLLSSLEYNKLNYMTYIHIVSGVGLGVGVTLVVGVIF